MWEQSKSHAWGLSSQAPVTEECHSHTSPSLASSWEFLPSPDLDLCPPSVPAGSSGLQSTQAAGGETEGMVGRGSPLLEAISPTSTGPFMTFLCSCLLFVSVSSPVGPPALLPLYFQWYIFYFVIQRKKWVVSIHGPRSPHPCLQHPEWGIGVPQGKLETDSRPNLEQNNRTRHRSSLSLSGTK